MPTLSLTKAEELIASALERSRTSKDNARAVAKALVLAEADGISTHGLIRTPFYAAQAKAEKVNGFATPAVCGGQIFVRTNRSLYCIGKSGENKE